MIVFVFEDNNPELVPTFEALRNSEANRERSIEIVNNKMGRIEVKFDESLEFPKLWSFVGIEGENCAELDLQLKFSGEVRCCCGVVTSGAQYNAVDENVEYDGDLCTVNFSKLPGRTD